MLCDCYYRKRRDGSEGEEADSVDVFLKQWQCFDQTNCWHGAGVFVLSVFCPILSIIDIIVV